MMEGALDHECIATIKGKRTKSQRLPSPSSDGKGVGTHKALSVIDGFPRSLSSSGYYNCKGTTMTTEEEEDTANCLILLSQGDCPRQPVVELFAAVEDDQEYGKVTSRKYLETNTGLGKIGYYVYECKTCNRTFPSFQALGGHRASHKKLKSTPNPTMAIPTSDEEGQAGESKKHSSLSPQFGNSSNGSNNLGKQGKVHECLICGAEFGSGQALGGHMRRHRAPPTPPHIRIAKLMESKDVAVTTTMSLDLDLNLPAPEGRNVENAFLIRQHKKQQPLKATAMVFSSPAMADCHY